MGPPFHDHVGLTIESAAQGRARLRMRWSPKHAQEYGRLQGGYLAMIADAAVHTAAATLMQPEERLTTVEMKVNFLAPVVGQDVIAQASILRRGRSIVVGEVDLRVESGDLVGKSLVTSMVLSPRPQSSAGTG